MRRTRETDQRVKALYLAGLGMSAVADIVGLSAGTVHGILVELRVQRRPRGRRWKPKATALVSGKKIRGRRIGDDHSFVSAV